MKKAFLNALLILGVLFIAGCSSNTISSVPSDFLFIMDVQKVGDFEDCPVNVNLRIDAHGSGKYEAYDTDCAIQYDLNHMFTYKQSQVLETGNFKLSDAELKGLWNSINQNNFFNLTDDYRMEIGFSYAFIVVKADGQQHIVDNIGMEVPEIRVIIEAADAVMPEGVSLDYGNGFVS